MNLSSTLQSSKAYRFLLEHKAADGLVFRPGTKERATGSAGCSVGDRVTAQTFALQ
jgi:hypothetical protein